MKRAPKIAAFLVSLALVAGAQAAVPDLIPRIAPSAGDFTEDVMPREPKFQLAQDFVPLEIILQALRDQYGGHQLTVSGPSRSGDGFVYRIKWLTEDGAVLYVTADAESGEVLSLEGE
jgi:uncharacterized membrane protein YkoI